MIEILMTSLDIDAGAVLRATMLLSDAERARAGRFVDARARRRFVLTRAELRQQIGARLEIAPRSVEFIRGAHGKPRLARRYGPLDLRFSVSHSDEVAALAFAVGREVGVDIEVVRPIPEAEKIAAKLCTPAEWSALQSLGKDERLRGFFAWWTRTEAYLKAQGAGLGQPLDAFDVTATGPHWEVRDFTPGSGLVGAVAFEASGEEQVMVRGGVAQMRTAA